MLTIGLATAALARRVFPERVYTVRLEQRHFMCQHICLTCLYTSSAVGLAEAALARRVSPEGARIVRHVISVCAHCFAKAILVCSRAGVHFAAPSGSLFGDVCRRAGARRPPEYRNGRQEAL